MAVTDPRTGLLAVAPVPGHLQLYDPYGDSAAEDLTVVPRAYVSRKESEKPLDTAVTHAAFNKDGTRLATVERRGKGIRSSIKFWHRPMGVDRAGVLCH